MTTNGPSAVVRRAAARLRAPLTEHPRIVPGVIDSGLSSLATFSVGLFATRELEPAALGAYALVFTAFGLACIIPDQLVFSPLEIDAVRHPLPSRLALLRRSLHIGVLAALGPAICLVAWRVFAPPGIPPEVLLALTITGAASAFVSPIQDHVRRMLHIAGTSWLAATVSMVQLVVAATTIIVFVVAKLPPWWAPFSALALANLTSLTAGVLLARWNERDAALGVPRLRFTDVYRSGRWLLVAGVLPNVAAFFSSAIVGAIAGAAALGYAESARVAGQPLLVLSAGLAATLGPRITAAAQQRDAAEARRVTRAYRTVIVAVSVVYLAIAAVRWRFNPLALLLPKAYVISGLVAITVIAHSLHGIAFPGRCAMLGAGRVRSLASIETMGGVARTLVSATASTLGVFAVPYGVFAVGVVRLWSYRRVLVRYFRGAPSVPSMTPPVTPPLTPPAAAPVTLGAAADATADPAPRPRRREHGGDGVQRVAMFVHTLNDRAVTRLTLSLCRQLSQMGLDVALVCGGRSPETDLAIPDGVAVVDLGMAGGPMTLGVGRLVAWLRAWRPDVLFAHLNGPGRAAVLARALARVPTRVVVVEHTHFSSFGWKRSAVRDFVTGALYARADRIAGVSPAVVDDLIARFPAIRGATALLPAAFPAADDLRAAAGATPDHPWLTDDNGARDFRIVCSVANVLPRKGQDALIRALPRVRAVAGDVRLLLVGRLDDPAFARELELLAARLGVADCVSFTGYHAQPVGYIARADAFALASASEGFSIVLLEAMACGVPVVATDAPGGISFVLDGGRCGLLVPPGDTELLASAIARALCDSGLRRTLTARGRDRAALFTPRRVAEAYLALADECWRASGAPRPRAERDANDTRSAVGGGW